jgi:hypothetical protein
MLFNLIYKKTAVAHVLNLIHLILRAHVIAHKKSCQINLTAFL